MPRHRITYQNWIVDLGQDPDSISTVAFGVEPDEAGGGNQSALEQLQHVVRSAVESLNAEERFFIVLFYFEGLSYRHISEESGLSADRLWGLHRRALRKLRRNLAFFVKRRYEIETEDRQACPICRSAHRQTIDNLISSRDKSRSWRPVIVALKDRYSLVIRSPQILIGHEKYHCCRQL